MAEFLTKLQLEEVEDGSRRFWERPKYKLLTPLVYKSDICGTIIVPAGFITDLTSVPRLPFVYILFGERVAPASVVHDFLYTVKLTTRANSDAVFREAANALGAPAWVKNDMYAGLRMFGWRKWRS